MRNQFREDPQLVQDKNIKLFLSTVYHPTVLYPTYLSCNIPAFERTIGDSLGILFKLSEQLCVMFNTQPCAF